MQQRQRWCSWWCSWLLNSRCFTVPWTAVRIGHVWRSCLTTATAPLSVTARHCYVGILRTYVHRVWFGHAEREEGSLSVCCILFLTAIVPSYLAAVVKLGLYLPTELQCTRQGIWYFCFDDLGLEEATTRRGQAQHQSQSISRTTLSSSRSAPVAT